MTGWRIAGLLAAWLLGVALQLQQARTLPPGIAAGELAAAMLLAGLGAVAWRGGGRPARRYIAGGLLLLGAALAGHGLTDLAASRRLAERLVPGLEGRDLEVTGTVSKLPQRSSTGQRFRLEVESARWRGEAVALPPSVSVGWYTGNHEDVDAPPRDAVRAGQRWRLTLRLRQPHGNLNPHGFDYELFLFEQGIGATGYVRNAPATLLDEAAAHPVERLRQRVRDAIDRAVADRRTAGVLAALAVGDQSAIDREDWQLFRDTGIAHLVSISGLHITMFAWLAALATGALWRRSSRAMQFLATPHAARWGGLALAAAYAVFSGWGVPAQRTIWMLALVTLLHSSSRRWPWPLILLAAAVAVTVADPWALLQPGFWLSFAAVGLLLAADRGTPAGWNTADTPAVPLHGGAPATLRQRLVELVRGAVRTQAIASFGLAPLTLIFFQQLSLVGLLANLVAIPLITLLITPLALLGALAPPLWQLGALLVRWLAVGLGWLAALAARGVDRCRRAALGAAGRSARRRLVRHAAAVASAAAGRAAGGAAAAAPGRAAGRGPVRTGRRRRRTRHRGAGADPRSPAGLRRRTAVRAQQRRRRAGAAAAAQEPGRTAHRPAGAEPRRQRPHRRRAGLAEGAAGRRAAQFAGFRPSVAAHGLPASPLRWPASAGSGTASTSRSSIHGQAITAPAPSRTRCRACCGSARASRACRCRRC